MQTDNEKMLQEIVQNTEMGKNTLDELMGLTHDQRLKDEMMRQKREYRRINQAAHTALDAIGAEAQGQSAAARTSDGKIDFYFKTRGETRVLAKILEQMDEDNYDGVHPVLISECGNQTAARLLEHGILAKWPEAPVRIVPCSGLCSFYAQDQGIIITY